MTPAELNTIDGLPLFTRRRCSQPRDFLQHLVRRLRRMAALAGLAIVLFIGAVSLQGAFQRVPAAQAQNVPEGLNKLEEKLNDVQALIRRVLYVFVGIGIAFCGFRFVQGDPHAWKFTMMVVVGATIVFASGEILTWLER